MAREASTARLLFGPFALDPARRLLHEGTHAVPLGSRAMDLLLPLLERAGGLVTQDELIARAWPGVVVDEVNLRVHISALRRALADGAGGARYIATVPGRGYRFICPVRREMAASAAVGRAIPPLPSSGAIGRQEVIERALARLAQQRLLTIVGPGGIGKTTVAIAVAEAFGAGCADGVCWVDLGALGRGDSVPMAVALAIGLANFTQDPTPGVIAWLQRRRMLLVLDCCERVVAAAAAMAERMLGETTGVHILATSREALRAAGEHVLRLPPLAIPPDAATLTAQQAMGYGAVTLFADRAAAVLGGFTLRDEDVAAVVRICLRLDGIALAIELAAGHLVAFDLGTLAAMLEDRFRLLAAGRRNSVQRHQTMHAALAWSYDIIPENERIVLRHLAVFEGGADLAAIRDVLGESVAPADVVAALARLTDKSLVAAESGTGGLAYRLLDTTRAFAFERLRGGGEAEAACLRYAWHMLLRLRSMPANGEENWLEMRRRALPDTRAALAWALAAPEQDALAVALATEAVALFYGLSLAEECRRRASEALGRMRRTGLDDRRTTMRLQASLAAASLYTPGPVAEHLALWESVLALAAELEDREYDAGALFGLLSARIHRDETEQALELTSRFRAVAGRLQDETRELVSERMTAIALHLRGEHQAARRMLAAMVARYDARIHGVSNFGFRVDHRLMANATLARVQWMQGDIDQAMRLCDECIDALLAQDHAIALCYALFEIAVPLRHLVGDLRAARREARRLQEVADRHGLAIFQAGAAWVTLALDDKVDEAACREAAEALFACGYTAQRAWLCALMAEAALRRGDVASGLDWIAAPLADCEARQGGWWWPELLRLRAELTVQADPADARADLARAVAIARKQGALSLELRAACSSVRLETGAAGDGLAALAALVGRFGQGFATADLVAARALLGRPAE